MDGLEGGHPGEHELENVPRSPPDAGEDCSASVRTGTDEELLDQRIHLRPKRGVVGLREVGCELGELGTKGTRWIDEHQRGHPFGVPPGIPACWSEAVEARRATFSSIQAGSTSAAPSRLSRDRHILVRHPALASFTRMVERVYGRLSPEEIGALLTAHFAPVCITGASDSVDSAGKRGRNGRSAGPSQRKQCPGAESNHRHGDFQSPALPTELPGRETPPAPDARERLTRGRAGIGRAAR